MRGKCGATVAWLALACATGLAFFAVCVWLVPMSVRATSVEPSPRSGAERTAPSEEATFPEVDWSYWQEVNPDVVGWVTVPGTGIDHPVVQASAEDPEFYLTHDVYRKRSVYGCPFLSVESSQGLLGAGAVVMGHHVSRGADKVFAPFASYLDPAFAAGHPVVLLQTPRSRRVLHVDCALAVDGQGEQTRSADATADELAAWRCALVERADVRLEGAGRDALQGFAVFVTCSYTRYGNERTLVVAS